MASCSIPANGTAVESTAKPNWLELPRDLTSNIFQKLGAVDILFGARNVCPLRWNICKDPLIWRKIHMKDIHILRYDSSILSKICRYAVDQSCGHLEDIYIKYFGTTELLKHIADSARILRCLRIEKCHKISNEGLKEVVEKLPLLEELELSNCRLLKNIVSCHVIGKCCPLLKSFVISGYDFDDIYACNYEALGIAARMPGLRHLKILKNQLNNYGLLKILDKCSLLESLDLRGCHNLKGNAIYSEKNLTNLSRASFKKHV